MGDYVAHLEDTEPKRRDRFRVTRAMLESAVASASDRRRLDVVDGFAEPARPVGFATAFRVEERHGGHVALLCDTSLEVDPSGRVLAPSVHAAGQRWQIRFPRLVDEHKNPRAALAPKPEA